MWAKSAKDTGNDFSGSADFQVSWCSKKKKPYYLGSITQRHLAHAARKEKKNNTGHIVTENHLGGAGEREKICQDFSNINHATSIKSYARIVNKEAVWEQHLREKTLRFYTSLKTEIENLKWRCASCGFDTWRLIWKVLYKQGDGSLNQKKIPPVLSMNRPVWHSGCCVLP